MLSTNELMLMRHILEETGKATAKKDYKPDFDFNLPDQMRLMDLTRKFSGASASSELSKSEVLRYLDNEAERVAKTTLAKIARGDEHFEEARIANALRGVAVELIQGLPLNQELLNTAVERC